MLEGQTLKIMGWGDFENVCENEYNTDSIMFHIVGIEYSNVGVIVFRFRPFNLDENTSFKTGIAQKF